MDLVTFSDEAKRLVNSYFPGLGVIPPRVGSGGLLGLIESTVNGALGGAEEGAAVAAGVAATDPVFSPFVRVEVQLTDVVVPLVDVPSTLARGSAHLYTFPAGVVLVGGVTADLTVERSSAGVDADWNGDASLGTIALTADVSDLTATPTAVAGVTTAHLVASDVFSYDGAESPMELHLNFVVDDADHDVTSTPCDFIVNGTIVLLFAVISP